MSGDGEEGGVCTVTIIGGAIPIGTGLLNICVGGEALNGWGAMGGGLRSGVLLVGWATRARPLPGMLY